MFLLENLLPDLMRNVAKLLPFRLVTVHSYERAVKFRRGDALRELPTGIHFHWVFVESIEVVPSVPEVVETAKIVATTRDGKPLVLSAAIHFEIVSATLYWTMVQDFEASLRNLAEADLAETVASYDALTVLSDAPAIASEVQSRLTPKLASWGVRLLSLQLANVAATRAYRLIME